MACQQEHRYHRHCPSCRPRRSQNHHLPLKKDPSPPPRTPHHAPPLRFLPQNITSLHAHTASKDATGFQRISRDVVGKRELRVLRRVSGEGSSTGGSHCRRPFEAKQRRHRRSMPSKTGSQPALPASPLSSSPQFLPLPQCSVSRILNVYFSDVLKWIYQILSRRHPRRF